MAPFARMAREDPMLANIYKINLSLREIALCMEKRRQIIGCMLG